MRSDSELPLQCRLFTPEMQWQSRGKRRISQGWNCSGLAAQHVDTPPHQKRPPYTACVAYREGLVRGVSGDFGKLLGADGQEITSLQQMLQVCLCAVTETATRSCLKLHTVHGVHGVRG